MDNVYDILPKIDGFINVRGCNLNTLSGYVEKLNKRAVKLSLAPLRLELGSSFFLRHVRYSGITGEKIEKLIPYTPVRVHGIAPIVNGWRFVAVISLEDTVNVLRVVPGFEEKLPVEFRTVSPSRCDHCRADRQRNESFVLQNQTTQEYKVVGRNCLKDFLGHLSPQALASLLAGHIDIANIAEEDNELRGDRAPNIYSLRQVLATALFWVSKFGFTSATKARETGQIPTSHFIKSWVSSPQIQDNEMALRKEFIVVSATPEFQAKVEKIIAHFAVEPQPNDSDFRWNLYALTSNYGVKFEQIGMATAMVSAYNRDQATQGEYQKSEYIGTVGKREVFTVIVKRVHLLESFHGLRTLLGLEDQNGNALNWFASGSVTFEVGDTLTGKATVAKHDLYKGYKQTTLTRCAFSVVQTQAA